MRAGKWLKRRRQCAGDGLDANGANLSTANEQKCFHSTANDREWTQILVANHQWQLLPDRCTSIINRPGGRPADAGHAYLFFFAALAPSFPRAVRVALGRCATVLFLLAAAAAFLMFFLAAARCAVLIIRVRMSALHRACR
jgi:hypothetical protein